MFFRDGVRRIDYILAFHDTEDAELVQWREKFESNLEHEGLELERESKKVGGCTQVSFLDFIFFIYEQS